MTGLIAIVSGIGGLYGYRGLLRHLHHGDAHALAHLCGREPRAVGVAHRVDEIVDE